MCDMIDIKKMGWAMTRAFVLTGSLAGAARAQFPSLRNTDTRTSTPETVMGVRKDWGVDANFGGAFNRGNTNVNYI